MKAGPSTHQRPFTGHAALPTEEAAQAFVAGTGAALTAQIPLHVSLANALAAFSKDQCGTKTNRAGEMSAARSENLTALCETITFHM